MNNLEDYKEEILRCLNFWGWLRSDEIMNNVKMFCYYNKHEYDKKDFIVALEVLKTKKWIRDNDNGDPMSCLYRDVKYNIVN